MRRDGVLRWSGFLYGLLIGATVACSPVNIPEPSPTPFDQLPTPTPFVPERPTDPVPTAIEAPPTAIPVLQTPSSSVEPPPFTGSLVGRVSSGVQIAVPNSWVDLTEEVLDPSIGNRLGVPALLTADSERAGKALLGGKPLEDGAYIMGLISSYQLANDNLAAGLEQLLADLDIDTVEDQIVPFVRINDREGTTAVAGAYVDVMSELPLLVGENRQLLQTRILFFTLDTADSQLDNQSQIILFMGTTPEQWGQFEPLFAQMAQTIEIHPIRPSLRLGDGTVAVLGELVSETAVSRTLNPRGRDLWTFRVDGQQYVTFSATPNESNLDLALKIFDPFGQVVTTVDNGFVGDTETVTDLIVDEPGLYIVEISDFSTAIGNYELQYTLSKTPLFSDGGTIAFGQSIQSHLPLNNQHMWTFSGLAEQLVSIVLMPSDEAFDAILDLYGPDGTRLVALDEGFSGDSEVISGFQLPVTGEYTILVRNFAGGTGAYSLALDEGGESTLNFYDAGDLAYGDVKEESLRANEAQAWFFEGRSNDRIMVKVTPLDAELDLEIWVLDPEVNRLVTEDSFTIGQPETIDLTLGDDGAHLILVRDFFGKAGIYQVQLMALEDEQPATIGTLTNGQTAVGTLVRNTTAAWDFEGEAGETISVILEPTATFNDLTLQLVSPAGEAYSIVDQTGSGQRELISFFELPISGRWQIVVEEFYGQPATYNLFFQTIE